VRALSWSIRDDVRILLAPFSTYRRRREAGTGKRGLAWLARPLLLVVMMGAFVTVGHGGELLPTLLVGSSLAFAWIPFLQILLVAPFIALARPAPLSWSRAVDLFFLGHGPWSLWLWFLCVVVLARPPAGVAELAGAPWLLPSAALAAGWTAVILFAYFRTVLALSGARAFVFTAAYQAAIGTCAYLFVGATTYRVSPFSLYPSYWP